MRMHCKIQKIALSLNPHREVLSRINNINTCTTIIVLVVESHALLVVCRTIYGKHNLYFATGNCCTKEILCTTSAVTVLIHQI